MAYLNCRELWWVGDDFQGKRCAKEGTTREIVVSFKPVLGRKPFNQDWAPEWVVSIIRDNHEDMVLIAPMAPVLLQEGTMININISDDEATLGSTLKLKVVRVTFRCPEDAQDGLKKLQECKDRFMSFAAHEPRPMSQGEDRPLSQGEDQSTSSGTPSPQSPPSQNLQD